MKLLLVSDGEALQEMTLNWAMDIIKKFKIDSNQVIFMSYELRSDETYKLLLNEFPKFRKYPLSVIGMDTYIFEPHLQNFGDLPLPTTDKKPYKYGTAWLTTEIPKNIKKDINNIIRNYENG